MSQWGIDDRRIAAALAAVRPSRHAPEPAGAASAAGGIATTADASPTADARDDRALYDGHDERDERGERDGNDECDELFARAIWSVLVEPGDGVAGALIDAVGAVAAAQMVIDRATPGQVSGVTQAEVSLQAAQSGLTRWRERLRAADVLRSLDSAARCKARMLVPGDPQWPDGLDALGANSPVLLWMRGNGDLLRRPAVAIVGARAATGYGEHVAMELAAGLSARDVVVVSGGAYGIDGMAHRAALASGGGTIAVLAGGIDRLYPAGHEALLTRVADNGLLISEVPCGTPPTKWRFLQRNRLIAALAAATVVVEAGRRSGSLNTARLALGLGRPVGVVPGPITSAASTGCHAIVREQPVTLVTSTAEIMELAFGHDEVMGMPDLIETGTGTGTGAGTGTGTDIDQLRGRVLDALRPRRGQTPREIARAVGEGTERVRGVLGVLDLDGVISSGADGLWRRAAVRSEVGATAS
jgi:DNA processing protein